MPQAEANVVSQNLLMSTSRKEISWCNRFGQASGPGLLRAGAWGPGPQGLAGPQRLGARAPRGLGPGPQSGWGLDPKTESRNQFFVILKSLLVGGWRRGGSQLKRLPQMWGPGGKRARDTPPTPPPPPPPAFLGCKGERKRVFTLSVTETIQHAPQGRRTFIWDQCGAIAYRRVRAFQGHWGLFRACGPPMRRATRPNLKPNPQTPEHSNP